MQPDDGDSRERASHRSIAEQFVSAWREKVGSRAFDNWLTRSIRVSIQDQQCTIAVPNDFLQRAVQRSYGAAARQTLDEVLGAQAQLLFMIDPTIQDAPRRDEQPRRTTRPEEPAPARRPAPKPASAQSRRTGRRMLELRDFVQGEGNANALSVARRLCQAPWDGPPLTCFFSGVGLGKTHLLQGIHQQIRREHPELKSVFLTAEMFGNQFSESLGQRQTASFRKQFRALDVLIVDDVEFLESKRVFEEEFLHTINAIEEQGGRLIVSCDRSPHLLTQLGEDLRNRLLAGVMCRLEPLDLEGRLALLQSKAERLGGEFAPEALKLIAERFHKNVRELEGALYTLHTHFLTTGKRVGATQARKLIADLERDCVRCVRISDVEQVICETFGVKSRDLRSSGRARAVAQPRMLAMYLARKHTQAPYSEIGKHFKRNHATVVSAARKVDEWLSQNQPLQVASQSWPISELIHSLEQRLQVG